ncbi:hypothetical protein Patl1_25153 [Pistacia atlantica]|uniref:Uncharacterized protein n=1 Tax=Pistacia atlantica TaxID=434234 RepID=A0ACC1B371_9ROSI|nr:hypothetical protein Patl1_25153 [Pistacia atlantica]
MDISVGGNPSSETVSDYDRAGELQAFDAAKTGVKGLVDAGIENIPRIFLRPPSPNELVHESNNHQNDLQVPLIDLGGKHEEIVDQVRSASETWGFFQVVNHGIPLNVFEGMVEGVVKFHEQDVEVKKEWYTRDVKRKVTFNSNFDLYRSKAANWRDTLSFSMSASENFDPQLLPAALRDAATEYAENVRKLGDTLFELLSEALGLKPDHLKALECAGKCTFVCHYYPACPQPKLTMGASSHSDPSFLTVLLQDHVGGLQVLHENQWADAPPIPGALVVNIGDYLQILSNDKFKSVDHRVLANNVAPRVSVACFFTGSSSVHEKSYGPLEELISEENPPVYKNFTVSENKSSLTPDHFAILSLQ